MGHTVTSFRFPTRHTRREDPGAPTGIRRRGHCLVTEWSLGADVGWLLHRSQTLGDVPGGSRRAERASRDSSTHRKNREAFMNLSAITNNGKGKLALLASLFLILTAFGQCGGSGTAKWTFKGVAYEGSSKCGWVDTSPGDIYSFSGWDADDGQKRIGFWADAFNGTEVVPGTYEFSKEKRTTLTVSNHDPEHFSYESVSGQAVISIDSSGDLHAVFNAVVADINTGADEQPVSGEIHCSPYKMPFLLPDAGAEQ
jgi:hypothetical protein